MIIHHVFFWLHEPSEANRMKLLSGLQTLGKISSVRKIHLGTPAATEDREVVENSYSVSELLFFDDLNGQLAYQQDPIHKQFIAGHSQLWKKVVVYDVEEFKV